MRLAWLVGFVGGLGCAAATPVETKAAEPLVEAGTSEAGQQDGSGPSEHNTPGQPDPRRSMGGTNTPEGDGGSLIDLNWLVPCSGSQCVVIFRMQLSPSGEVVRRDGRPLHIVWVGPASLLAHEPVRLLVTQAGGTEALALKVAEMNGDSGPWRRYVASLTPKDAALLASGSGLQFALGPLSVSPNSEEFAKIHLFTGRLLQMMDLEDRMAAAPSRPAPATTQSWQCYRIESADGSYARCERTRDRCERVLTHLTKDRPDAKTSGCAGRDRAACHSAFSKLDRFTLEECAPSFEDCEESRRFFLSQPADWEDVAKCVGTGWSPPK